MEHQKLLVGKKTGVPVTEKHLAIHAAVADMHVYYSETIFLGRYPRVSYAHVNQIPYMVTFMIF